jgi:hydroxyacylglutathione hydrolase
VALHVRQSRFLHYNAGAFVSAGEALLLDPGILAAEIDALVADLGGAKITTIVLTHSDWDHVLGPEHLPPVSVVAQTAYETELDPDGVRVAVARLEAEAGVTRRQPFEPPRPTETFEDALDVQVGDLTVRLEHAPGHTADMLTAYESESATLWAADVLSDVEIPLVGHDLGDYERTLERIASMTIRTLVPGHGSATGDADEIEKRIAEDRRYLQLLRAGVEDAVSAELSLEEAVAVCADPGVRRSDEDGATHCLNVEKVYADLGGDADPDAVGYVRAWKELTGR